MKKDETADDCDSPQTAQLTPRELDVWHAAFVGVNDPLFAVEWANRAVWRYRDHLASDEPSLLKNANLEKPHDNTIDNASAHVHHWMQPAASARNRT